MIRPSRPAGEVWPSPVPKRTTGSPGLAGLLAVFRVPSALSAASGPEPEESAANRPGTLEATGMVNESEVPFALVTVTAVWDGLIPYGTMAPIWVPDAYMRGAAIPSNRTVFWPDRKSTRLNSSHL